MKIELRLLETIHPYHQNPRDNDDAVAAVVASIREFGFRQPIVVDREGTIVVGHTRYRAAQKLGLTQVPVHVATDLVRRPGACLPHRRQPNRHARRLEREPAHAGAGGPGRQRLRP